MNLLLLTEKETGVWDCLGISLTLWRDPWQKHHQICQITLKLIFNTRDIKQKFALNLTR